jgi:hypothetical protein
VPVSSHSLKALEIRRRLLTAEADIHRERLREEWGDFKASFHAVDGAVNSVRKVASIVSLVGMGIRSFRQLREKRGNFVSKILAGAGLVSTLWLAARSRSRSGERA